MIGRLLLASLLALVLLGSAFTAGASAASANPRLAAVKDFAFGLGSGNLEGDISARFAGYDLVFVDGEEASPQQIAELQSTGTIVMGYLSIGTIEPYRSWYKRLKPFRLKQKFEEFDEFYANVKAAGYRKRIVRIARGILAKGFDGLFLDNVDMIQLFRKQKRGMRRLVRRLSSLAHSQGRFLFAQNGANLIGPMLPFLDGWNREDVTWSYNFERRTYFRLPSADRTQALADLQRIGSFGLLTLATDYTAGDAEAFNESVGNACAVGAIPFVSNIELTRIPQPPPACP